MSCDETITIPKSEYRALLYASARSQALNDYTDCAKMRFILKQSR